MNEKLIEDYKLLHQIPEEGFKEFETKKYILEKLKPLDCTVYEIDSTGVLAFFNYGKKETIAFRCELDGLEIEEENEIE